MAASPYPSIPNPTGTIQGLLATVIALQQTVNLLIASSVPGSGSLSSSARTFQLQTAGQQQAVSLSAETNAREAADLTINNKLAMLGGTQTTQGSQISTQQNQIDALVTLAGNKVGTVFSVLGALQKGQTSTLQIPGSDITAGTLTPHAYNAVAGNLATVTITAPYPGDLLVLGAVTAINAAPVGTGALVATIDGAASNLCALFDGNPTTSFGLFAVGAGTHTITLNAHFVGPPIADLNGLALFAMMVPK